MHFSHTEFFYWLATAHLDGIGTLRIQKALNYFDNNIKNVFSASGQELQNLGFKEAQINTIKQVDWKRIEKTFKWCELNSCSVLTYCDPDYPSLLKEIVSAPTVLFILGDPQLLSIPQLAMVGSRNPTPLGIKLAEDFAACLAKAGLAITSGLALGIDAASHRGALLEGRTIGVCGSGLDIIYPSANKRLAEEILKKDGAVISEFPPYTPVKTQHFPMRNRIISGLSLGVLVVEAALRSGSLITARYAVDQNREVFAMPGSIYNPLARGCHQLIRQGAKLVETAQDILEELKHFHPKEITDKPQTAMPNLNSAYKKLLRHIGYEVTPLDTILARSRLTAGQVSSMLLSLELMGLIKTVPGGYTICLTS